VPRNHLGAGGKLHVPGCHHWWNRRRKPRNQGSRLEQQGRPIPSLNTFWKDQVEASEDTRVACGAVWVWDLDTTSCRYCQTSSLWNDLLQMGAWNQLVRTQNKRIRFGADGDSERVSVNCEKTEAAVFRTRYQGPEPQHSYTRGKNRRQ